MATISSDAKLMTLINTFYVEPGKADQLIELLVDATEKVMRNRPGFISANFHKSEDGTRVVNYAQWASKADFAAMQADPEAQIHMKQAGALATRFEPAIYSVVFAD
jgi:heme-degrading monooxygenase HmoA